MPVLSTHAFAQMKDLPADEARLIPFEVRARRFALAVDDPEPMESYVPWVAEHWQSTLALRKQSPEFATTCDALDQGQFVENPSLRLISLWAALEALFSTNNTELTFRVSSLIATFLEPAGDRRALLQKHVAKLYGKRSSAAHGGRAHNDDDILATFELVRRVLYRMIEERHVPTPLEMERRLFD